MAGGPPRSSDQPSTISWTVAPETTRWLHLLAYGLYAPLGAVALALLGGAAAAATVLLLEGSFAPVALLALAVLVAFSRPPVLAAIRSDETGASPGYEGWSPNWRGILVASVLCGTGILAAALRSRAAAVAVAAVSFVAGLVAMALYTDATIDADGRLTTQDSGVELRTLSGVRSLELPGLTLFWLAYARGADGFRNPRLLAVPHERAAAVRGRLSAGVAADPDADPISRAERAVVALVGVGVLTTGPALWLLVGDAGADAAAVLIYPVAFSLVFAAPMLWYAWKG